MNKWLLLPIVLITMTLSASAATLDVPAGGDLQAAINAAQPGDAIRLAPGATYVGNFVLPAKAGTAYITIRTGGDAALLPPPGTRITPVYSPYLARIQSPNTSPAMRTQAGAGYWRLELLEFMPTQKGYYDIVMLGDGSSAQNTPDKVPHHLVIDRVYIHGHRVMGQKRGIALNSAFTTISNSYVSDIKAVGQDSQAIGGWNGPGPYHVENNYLEASGNVVLIGGDDPKIAGLIATDLTFRGNTMTRPVAWRDAIVPTPSGVQAAAGLGTLPAGTFAYRVAARQDLGASGTGTSAASPEVVVTVAAGASVTLSWQAVPDAKDYVVYGRTPGGQTQSWVTTSPLFVDDGVTPPASGTPPSKGTVWTVKNIFELKNARQVQVDFNLMENNWAQAQNGIAILLTPRNQYGSCTWCVVEDVTMEYNVIRRTGGALSILGTDNLQPTQQTNRIRIRHNEFSDYSKFWGGSGYAFLLDSGSRDVVFDHNTIVSGSQGTGMFLLSGTATTGLVVTNNLARHDYYGVFGSGMGSGTAALNYYAPGAVFTKNVLAGGRSSQYPANNLFPTVESFAAHFVDYTSGNFALVPGTDWERAGTDGLDLGADMAALRGGTTEPSDPPLTIETTSLMPALEGQSYTVTLSAQGGRSPYTWSLAAGALPTGLQLNGMTGEIAGAPVAPGDWAFTVQVRDSAGATTSKPLTIHVSQAIAPVSIVTMALPQATATLPYTTVLQASGGLGTYSWMVSSGQLPAGLTLSSAGTISGTTTSSGTFQVEVTAVDVADASRTASRMFTLAVAAPPNLAPTVSIAGTNTAQLAAPVTFTATPMDPDGFITVVDFLVDGVVTHSSTIAPFTFNWTATAGAHVVTARATDNRGASATSAITVTTTTEIVLRAGDVKAMAGRYQLVGDVTAAGGTLLYNINKNSPKVLNAVAAPANYAEFEFYAEAGRPYHVWIRSKALRDEFTNDSAYLQFSNMPSALIGTTAKLIYQLEDAPNAGLAGWGWQDNGLGTAPNQFGTHIVFEKTGLQRLRIQSREDGLYIDQIIISPDRYLLSAPGSLKGDATVVAR